MTAVDLALAGLLALATHVAETSANSPAHEQAANLEDATAKPFQAVASESTSDIPDHWLELARCESGNWHDGGATFSGPIRWDWGAPGMDLPPWGTDLHHGGLQFAPSTWEWVAGDLDLLDTYPHAYDAPAHVQVEVAAEVQLRQGWEAWPVCARRTGLLP